MVDYNLTETVTLPSQGKIYNTEVAPDITLRSMNTNDEMLRLSHSEYPYKNLCKILDDCMVEPCGISSYDMCIGDYQFLLHRLRVVTYGSEYRMNCSCPYCKSRNESSIDLDSLPVISNIEDIEKYSTVALPKSGKTVTLNLQTPRLMDKAVGLTADFKKRTQNKLADQSGLFIVQTLINTVDGEKLNSIELNDFVKNLPMLDTTYILNSADKMNSCIGIDTDLITTCEVCGLDFKTAFKMTAEFFRPTINI